MIKALRRHPILRQAFSLTEIMAVSAIVTSIPAAQYARAKQKVLETSCRSNLRQIGQMITMFKMGEGSYPKAVFYPNAPFKDPNSIAMVLERAGYKVPRKMWVCTAAPEALSDRGMTFIYNEKCGGRNTISKASKAWLLIEMNCLSKRIPPPHPGGYNVLCADGHVVTTTYLPPDLAKLQQACIPEPSLPTAWRRLAMWFKPHSHGTTAVHAPATL